MPKPLPPEEVILLRESLNYYQDFCECCGERNTELLWLYQYVEGIGNSLPFWAATDCSRAGRKQSFRSLQKAGWPKSKNVKILCFNCGESRIIHGRCQHQLTAYS